MSTGRGLIGPWTWQQPAALAHPPKGPEPSLSPGAQAPAHVSATSLWPLWPALTHEAVSVWTPRLRLETTQAVVTPGLPGMGGNGEFLFLSGSANPAKLKMRTQFGPEWMFLGT